MFVSVVVPCYRSVRTLPTLVERLTDVLANATIEHEIILVVDDSPDGTWDVATGLTQRFSTVRAILLARNYGQHSALIAGVRAARHELVVTMDDDLQHPPEEIPRILAALDDDVDLVYARPVEEEHGLLRSAMSELMKIVLAGPLSVQSARHVSAFRVFRTFLRKGFDEITSAHVSLDVALSWCTSRVRVVDVRMEQRTEGRSGYDLRSLFRHAVNMLVGYSMAPLRFVSYLGLGIGTLGMLLFGAVLWSYFSGTTTVTGFTSVASMIALFSSAQLLGIGVLGEYLGRVHTRGMGRPTYVIRTEVGPVTASRNASPDRRLAVTTARHGEQR